MLQPIRHTARAITPVLRSSSERAPVDAETPSGAARDRAPTPPCVLVVDDEADVRLLARFALEERGYTVLEAEEGRSAIAMVATDATADESSIDVVLLDVTMPGLDGIEVLGQLREIRPIPVILSSGHPESWARDRIPAGVDTAYLRKPYSFVDLADHLDAMLSAVAERA